MYIIDTLYGIYKKKYRKQLIDISKRLSESTGKSRVGIIADMLLESLFNGAPFAEYYDFDFICRDRENRKTYITTFYNFKLYDKINPKELRPLFHNKIEFLSTFKELIKRDYLDITVAGDDEIQSFIAKHRSAVIKGSWGDCGKEVEVIDIPENMTVASLKSMMAEKGYSLIEERVSNCEALSALNETSLNTIRIVTININSKISYLFAGLRVGAEGAAVDNISQGGSAARINIETGEIDTPFYTKHSFGAAEAAQASAEGFIIPLWAEVKELAARAAKVVPQMGIVAWDICVTQNGPEIIEGNESFGCDIMQLYQKHDEKGLKPLLLEILSEK